MVSLTGIDPVHRHAEFHLLIGRRDLHGRGVGTEATRADGASRVPRSEPAPHLLVRSALEHRCDSRCARRPGSAAKASPAKRAYKSGRYHDLVLMGVLSHEFDGGASDDAVRPSPIYVTRPLLPPLEAVTARLAEVWATQLADQHRRAARAARGGAARLSRRPASCRCSTTARSRCSRPMRALELRGEVITTPFTFPATPHALSWSGHHAGVLRHRSGDARRSIRRASKRAITPRTTGILAVHVYGIPCDVDGLQRVADRHGLKLDLRRGARLRHAASTAAGIGNFGDVTMFSFHATKLFHTAEGGALACRDAALRKPNRRPEELRHHRSRDGRRRRPQRQDERAAGGARARACSTAWPTRSARRQRAARSATASARRRSTASR